MPWSHHHVIVNVDWTLLFLCHLSQMQFNWFSRGPAQTCELKQINNSHHLDIPSRLCNRIYRWLSARLQYLQCVSDRDPAVDSHGIKNTSVLFGYYNFLSLHTFKSKLYLPELYIHISHEIRGGGGIHPSSSWFYEMRYMNIEITVRFWNNTVVLHNYC